ncbi:MAG TPA: tetratricopeptide repeat protein [Gammaproteobacteria bacterium]|nr:tetratricopeptide repeat protein [Gammaproteobacteria bacterium]
MKGIIRTKAKHSLRIAVLLLGLGAAAAASAFSIEYGSDRPAELAKCDRMRYTGQGEQASTCYAALLNQSADERIQAEAARALGDYKTANARFKTAVEKFPEDAGVRTRWGWLFLDTHQAQDAVQLFLEALKIDPEYAPAKLGLASVSADRFEDKARQWVAEVLDKDPENVLALLLVGRMDLEEGELDKAHESLAKAQKVIERDMLPPLELYSLLASEDLLRRKPEPSPYVQRALDYNKNYGQIYETQAHFYIITRRYREAIALLERAVELQPDLYSAHAELGVNLLRENRVDEAQQHLALAYRGDPYSPQIVNTLRLIDSFDNFDVARNAPKPGDAGPTIITRLRKDEEPVLEPYVLDLARRAIATYTKSFEFDLAEPVVVELYPNHDDFAVRTSGLPGIGLLGVTFGYLVAMDSPSGRPKGEFHWGTTLWHELAHVFTLEKTSHLVPRWFSEGVSVYEEWSTGPLKGRHLPISWFQALKENKLLPVADLDGGFIRPTYQSQVIVSYMQAGLICEYISGRWGEDGIRGMLTAFADGLDTPGAIKRALGVTAEEFDKTFDAYIKDQFGGVVASLDGWQKSLGDAHQAFEKKDWAAAEAKAKRSIELFPDFVEEGSGYLVEARAAEEQGDKAGMLGALEEYRTRGGYDPDALRKLADTLHADGKRDEAIAVGEDLLLVAPLDEELHASLGDWLLEAKRPKDALAEYQAYAAMKPHDQAAVHYRLARAYLGLDDRERGREELLYALEIAPHYRDAQKLLLEIVK